DIRVVGVHVQCIQTAARHDAGVGGHLDLLAVHEDGEIGMHVDDRALGRQAGHAVTRFPCGAGGEVARLRLGCEACRGPAGVGGTEPGMPDKDGEKSQHKEKQRAATNGTRSLHALLTEAALALALPLKLPLLKLRATSVAALIPFGRCSAWTGHASPSSRT